CVGYKCCPNTILTCVSVGQLDLLSEDYEAVDHRLKLFLDVEVFEEEEELHSFLKVSTVKFGDPVEFPSFLVVSDQRIYFLEVTSDMEGQPCDWLQKRDSRGITELSYLEVGLGSQSIHMEFEDGPVAYTLLVRDSVRCKRFFSLFTGKMQAPPPPATHTAHVLHASVSHELRAFLLGILEWSVLVLRTICPSLALALSIRSLLSLVLSLSRPSQYVNHMLLCSQ
ncbi:unnamed protein product, partial [Oncorhynchus mykiss]